jgi:hypothetical protein
MGEVSGQLSGGSIRVVENRQFLKTAFFRISLPFSAFQKDYPWGVNSTAMNIARVVVSY